MSRLVLSAICLLYLTGCAAAAPPHWTTKLSRDHPLVGKIWRPDWSIYVSTDMLMDSLSHADLVFLGEKHDNPDDHLLQAWLIDQLAAQGRHPAVVFEMIDEDKQKAIDTYVAAHPQDASGLGKALDWEHSGWPAWKEYEPIAEAALQHHLPIIAGSLTRRMTRDIGRDGVSALPAERRRRLQLDDSLTQEQRDTMLDIVAKGHCGLLPREALMPMVTVQRARDAVLADNMLRAFNRPDTDSAVLIAGAGHARSDLGAPAAAADMYPGLRRVSIAFVEVQDSADEPGDYASDFSTDSLPFDFVWFTPRVNDRDYCAELRERFSKAHKAHKKK